MALNIEDCNDIFDLMAEKEMLVTRKGLKGVAFRLDRVLRINHRISFLEQKEEEKRMRLGLN